MKAASGWVALLALGIGVGGATTANAIEGLVVGAEVAAAVPLSSLGARADLGGAGGIFAGYMFNDYIGLVGGEEYVGFFAKDRPNKIDQGSQFLDFHAGPRFALPIELGNLPTDLHASWQPGVYTGLIRDTPGNHTSWGFTTGLGWDFRITDDLLFGPFARYNWVDQRVHPTNNNIQFVTTGLALTYNALPEPEVVPAPAPPPPPAPPVVKKKLVLRGVHFDFDKADIRPDARPLLDNAVRTLQEEGDVTVIAEGHTDSKGGDEYNQKLSERRAQAVRAYLVGGGIAANRITSVGLGKSKPVATNATDDGRAQNRRVELRIRDNN